MEVMVAQHHGDVGAVSIEPSQHLNIARAAIDQVTHAPESVFVGIKFHLFQQALERLKTALYVADDVGAHSGYQCVRSRSGSSVGAFEFRDKDFLFRSGWGRAHGLP